MLTAFALLQIRAVIEAQSIKIYQPPVEEDDEAAAQHARSLMTAMPFAVIGSEKDVKTSDGRIVKGRQYTATSRSCAPS
jgi:cell division control protein 12